MRQVCLAVIWFFVVTKIIVNVVYAKPKIQVVTENWYPYNYLDQSGHIVGKSTKAVKQILTLAGMDYSIELYPWTRALKLAATRPNILIYSILRTPDREPLYYWFCPISAIEPHVIYKLTDRTDISVKTPQDIQKYTISVTRKIFLHQYMLSQGLVDGLNLQINSDDALGIRLFFAGRVDLIADLASAMERTLISQGLNKSVVTPLTSIGLENYSPICMALSKQTPIELVNKIKKAYQHISSKK